MTARMEAAFAARDLDAIDALLGASMESVDHTNAITHGREGHLDSSRRMLRLPGLVFRLEPLATLGERLCLLRRLVSASGTAGGNFDVAEYEMEHVGVLELDADGHCRSFETFAADHLGEAVVRVYERHAERLPEGPERRRAAAAARSMEGMFLGLVDRERLANPFSPEVVWRDQRIAGVGTLHGDAAVLAAVDAFLALVRDARWRVDDVLASCPDALLVRATNLGTQRASGGAFERQIHSLTVFDADGRIGRWESFDAEREAEALARFDQIGLNPCPESATASPTWQFGNAATRATDRLRDAWEAGDWDRLAAFCPPGLRIIDRRRMVQLETDRDHFLETFHPYFAMTSSVTLTTVGTRGDRLVLSAGAWTGADSEGGAARARFAELALSAADARPTIATPTLATAATERLWAAFDVQDLDAARALCAADFVWEDRRPLVGLCGDLELMIASARERLASGARHERRSIVGTAGERVAIARVLWAGGPAAGRFEVEFFAVHEFDAAGRCTASVFIDPDDPRAAQREAWARWAAIDPAVAETVALVGEADDAFNAHDRSRLLALLADDLVVEDHRRTGMGRIEGAAAYADSVAVLWDLSPDTRVELGGFWLAADAHGGLYSMRRTGNVAGGGPFESDYLQLIRHAQGRLTRAKMFELDQRDAALARWSALASTDRPDPPSAIAPPNAASAAMDRWQAAFESGDWAAVRALGAPEMMIEDRRGHAQIAYNGDTAIADWRVAHAAGARPQRRLLGTAGERIAIEHLLWTGGPPAGRWEIEFLWLFEVGDDGRFAAAIAFDADDRRAAQREAWARWAALDPNVAAMTTAFGEAIDAWNAEDVERLRACFADDLVVEDHRRTGTGRSEGREAYLRSVQALWQLAPGSRFEAGWYWLAIAAQSGVYPARRFGTLPDGGAFESEFLGVGVVDRGRTRRIELLKIDAVDAALARFCELTRRPGARPDLLRIPPNAAAEVGERQLALIAAGDWDAVRVLHAPSLVFDDRRPGLRTTTDGEAYLAGLRWANAGRDLQLERTLLATAGDRLALHHNRFTRTGEIFEIDTLAINEVDAEGRLAAVVLFAPDDRAAASTELFERYAALGADGASPVALEVLRAWNAHDLERLRALLPDDFYLDDRRRTGVGRLDGADAFLTSLAAMWELSRDLRLDVLYFVASPPHGRLYVARWSGTNAEGGEFDAVFVCLGLASGDRPVGLELFELDDLDAARARFEELRVAAPC